MTQKFQFSKKISDDLKMFLDIVGIITRKKISILNTFQGGGGKKDPDL